MKHLSASMQKFYSENAEIFFNETRNIDLSSSYKIFLEHLDKGAFILDLGCGSGRDSKRFSELGYCVESWEPNHDLACLAEKYLDYDVKRASSFDLKNPHVYEGIWASASLLHLDLKDFCTTLLGIRNALKWGGVFYASFKWGLKDLRKEDRFFLMMTEERLSSCFERIDGLNIVEIRKRADHRPEKRGEHWLECISILKR